MLNHFAAWQEAALRVVGDLRAGRWGRLGPSVERFNREQHAADRDRPLDETLQRLQSARAALLQLLAQVDEATLLNEYGRQTVGWWAKWTWTATTSSTSPTWRRLSGRFGADARR